MRARTSFVLAVLVGFGGLILAAPATAAPTFRVPRRPQAMQRLLPLSQMKATFSRHRHAKVCGRPSAHYASCNAVIDQNVSGNVTPNVLPAGFGPADLQAAYQLPSGSAGSGQTVAVVDAYDLPTAESDLAAYRSKYGLPSCTTANGCFQKVNQAGGTTPLPAADPGWGQEIALDLDMVSAACPNCSILLVEANSPGMSDLGTAENTAVTLGATAVSNSWGSTEASDETLADGTYFNHPGVAITASAGDSGYGVEYPAASPDVIAVGGTTLTVSGGTRGYSETAWSGTGSGCSLYEAKPSWQSDSGCANRSVVDVAADADPDTGVAVYDSTPSGGQSGWLVFGGTSAAAPFVAGAYELANHTSEPDVPAQALYTNPGSFFDVTSGSNGTCAPAYLCNAQAGYDGPTGLGTLDGVSAFTPTAPTPPATPDAPTVLSAVAGDGKVSLSWQAPANNGGSPITGYVVTPSIGGAAQPAHIFLPSVTSAVVAGLSNGTSYTFTVAAANVSGTGSPSAASSAVMPFDALTNKYLALGGASSYLGARSGAEVFLPGGGRSQAYAGGTIYWSLHSGAHVVHGVILAKYLALGATRSAIGYPTTDQGTSPDHVGLYNHFSKGAIYWSPAYGAHDVVGAIETKWASTKWELGSLGYPTTDSLISADHVGVYNHFAKGSIYWQPTLGAHYVLGPLQAAWFFLGAERGRLGYPTGDSYMFPGGWRSNFQRGYVIYMSRTRGIAVRFAA